MSSNFDALFSAYAKFGDTRSDGQRITLSNSDKWMRSAGLLITSLPVTRPSSSTPSPPQAIKFTSTETGIEFKKIAKIAKAIDKNQFDVFIDALVRRRVQEEDQLSTARIQVKNALVNAGPPALSSATSHQDRLISTASSSTDKVPSVVARLTDHTKYTGSHKLRFDQETGKGRGKAGRE